MGASAGVESIDGSGDGIVTVVFRQPVGDARFALQNKMGPGIRVGRRDMEIRTAGDADHGLARIARALRRVVSFIDEMQEALAAANNASSAHGEPVEPPSVPVNGQPAGDPDHLNGSDSTNGAAPSKRTRRRRRRPQIPTTA